MFEKPDNWNNMGPDEKIKARLDFWESMDGIAFENHEAEEKYREKVHLYREAVCMTNTSRVPSIPLVGDYVIKRAGLKPYDALYEPKAIDKPLLDFNREFDPDSAIMSMFFPGKVLELIDYKLYTWAGHGLPKDSPFQTMEGEYMMPDEYPDLIRDPSGFFLKTYLPRVCGALDPLSKLPNLPLQQEIVSVTGAILPFGMPDTKEMLKKLMEAGDIATQWMMNAANLGNQLSRMGIPSIGLGSGVFCKAPFDQIGDTLRGTKGMILDMFRQPANVIAACEKMLEIALHDAIKTCDMLGRAFATFPLHKGADGFMSQKQFETFYWPTLKAFMEGLNEEGIMPILFAEGSYLSRLETVADYPKARAVWYFDQTDMRRAKEALGDVACIQGNVPSSLMQVASVDDLRAYCENLLELFADDGAFILTNGCSVDTTTDEHVRTMINIVRQ